MFDDYTGAVLDIEEGKRIAHALGDHKAAILANHGLLTVGRTVDEAAWWFITMERTCQVQLLAEAAGTPVDIGHEVAEKTAGQTGRPPRRLVSVPTPLRRHRGRGAGSARTSEPVAEISRLGRHRPGLQMRQEGGRPARRSAGTE